MATYTENYSLKKPSMEDNASIDDINENMDTIDNELSQRAPIGADGKIPVDAVPVLRKELCRFTQSGTFYPSQYPTADGRYDIVLQGGGGSGAAGSSACFGGEAGGFLSLSGVPLLSGVGYPVTVGAGGTGVRVVNIGVNLDGNAGGATSVCGYTVPGGAGGLAPIKTDDAPTATVANNYTQNVGTSDSSGAGGNSIIAAGGKNAAGTPGAGSLGSGGGASLSSSYTSGAGGTGVVIIYGFIGGAK